MRPSITLLALAAAPISALNLNLNLWPRAGSCPAVWTQVAADLKNELAGCGRASRTAMRLVFHDCFTSGCDGSILLTNECTTRPENKGLDVICSTLNTLRQKHRVGAADMVQFAGAYALSTCARGPRVQALVGRKDSNVPAPPGGIPSSRDPVPKILDAFARKGFSPEDLVALLGTHSTARQFFDDPKKANSPLDTTPEVMDITYYSQTKFGGAPYSLQSDRLLSNATETWRAWAVFTKSTASWSDAFIPAWNRLATLGSDPRNLQDCSALIPQSSVRREASEANEDFVDKLRKKFIA